MAKLGELISTCNGRLTLTSGTPVTTSDVTAATSVYFCPYKGNNIALYNVDFEEWRFYNFSEISYSLAGKTADTNYDVFVYDNAGTLTLELVAWTDDTNRATALATQDGIYVLTGSLNKRYLGTIRITSTTGQCEDSYINRYVSNYYNRVARQFRRNAIAEHTYGTTSWRAWNNDANNCVRFVACTSLLVHIHLGGQTRTGTGCEYGVEFDSTTDGNQFLAWMINDLDNTDYEHQSSSGCDYILHGYHTVQINEISFSSSTYYQYSLTGFILM